MKKIQLVVLVFFLSLAFISCQKTSVNEQTNEVISEKNIANLKTWYENKVTENLNAKSNLRQPSQGKINWDEAIIMNNNKGYLIPITVKSKLSITKFLQISTDNAKGNSDGEYVYIIDNDILTKTSKDYKAQSELLDRNEKPDNFNGAIIRYSIKNELQSSLYFENGSASSSKNKIIAFKEIENKSIPTNTSENILARCWGYFLNTYIDGILVDSQLLYVSCTSEQQWTDTIEGDGSGGGGGTPTTWIGQENGYPFGWWTDPIWIQANIKMGKDEGPNPAEIALIMQYPVAALFINNNAGKAEDETIVKFGTNGLNNQSDAFRHAYWQALNTKSVGGYMTLLFSSAHETSTPNQFSLEKEMDIHNNLIGIALYNSNPGLTNAQYSLLVWNAGQNGNLVYLTPINYNSTCYWGCPGNPLGDHGISSSTHITPTP
jgi:hypothetical protein